MCPSKGPGAAEPAHLPMLGEIQSLVEDTWRQAAGPTLAGGSHGTWGLDERMFGGLASLLIPHHPAGHSAESQEPCPSPP